MSARITAVADTLVSLTSDRPYPAAIPVADALAVIREERGRQFDPAVVDALLRLAHAGELDDPGAPELAGEWLGEPVAAGKLPTA